MQINLITREQVQIVGSEAAGKYVIVESNMDEGRYPKNKFKVETD